MPKDPYESTDFEGKLAKDPMPEEIREECIKIRREKENNGHFADNHSYYRKYGAIAEKGLNVCNHDGGKLPVKPSDPKEMRII
jgi:hypothetical protein